jgi:hypothetical protein
MNGYGRTAGENEYFGDQEMPFRENAESGTKMVIDFTLR